MTVTGKNLNVGSQNGLVAPFNAALNLVLYIVTISEGCLTIEDNRSVTQIGVMSQNDVLNSLNAPLVDFNEVKKFAGASFWSNVKDFFSDVGHGVKKAYDTIAPIARVVAPIIRPLLGVGAYSGGVPSGGMTRRMLGGAKNSYAKFLKEHKGQGYSRTELSAMYHQQYPKGQHKKGAVVKKARAKAKKCKAGKVKRKVMRCEAPAKKKGRGIVYGGAAINRSDMHRMDFE